MPSLPRTRLLGVLASLAMLALALLGLRHLFRAATLRLPTPAGSSAAPPAISSPQFEQVIASLTGTTFSPGNTVEILSNGDETFPRLLDDLRRARRSIAIQMYYQKGGAVADSVARVLLDRRRAGVAIYFMFDAIGTSRLGLHGLDSLRAAGVPMVAFRPFRWYELDRFGHRAHTRAIIIDGVIGYTGGFGLDDKWLGGGRRTGQWRETNVRVTGPVVARLQGVFAREWSEATGELLASSALFPVAPPAPSGPTRAGVLHSVPSRESSEAERLLLLSIAGARRTLWISNAYFVPNRTIRQLLVEAARRGVNVRVITGGKHTDINIARRAGRASYTPLLEGGVHIYEYEPSMMHVKTFVVDGLWSTIGTVNLDNRSLALNNEVTLLVHDSMVGRVMDSLFLADLGRSREVRADEFRRRPWTERVIDGFAKLVSRVL